MSRLTEWDEASLEEKEEVSTDEIRVAVAKMADLRSDYEEKKKVSTEAHYKYEEAKNKVISLLDRASLTTMTFPKIGKVTKVSKMVVSCPKGFSDKEKLFSYLKKTEGAEGFLRYTTVNHNSLNSLYKKHFEEASDPASFEMPGVDKPIEQKTIRFTKEK